MKEDGTGYAGADAIALARNGVMHPLDPLTVTNFVDIITYNEEFPVFYFDVSKQSERLSQCVVDIKIRMRFAESVGANVGHMHSSSAIDGSNSKAMGGR